MAPVANAARRLATLLAAAAAATAWPAQASQCYGTVSHGRLDGGVKLPVHGPNFAAYSNLGATVGRTAVHQKVVDVILASYAALAVSIPSITYVYGQTGFPEGGPFKPHKTHQNGLSADFFVPVRTSTGLPAILPSTLSNRFGYLIEFDARGRYQNYQIDVTAYAEHLYELQRAATARSVGISLVIVDPAYLPLLFATPRGPSLREHLPFMLTTPFIRHDEHFHVDFSVPCAPLK